MSIFVEISTQRLHTMLEAAKTVINSHRVLAKTGDTVVGELLACADEFIEWDHYPPGDIYDKESHCQAYYHSHGEEERAGENGHFHCFVDEDARPDGLTPVVVPAPDDDGDIESLTHLIGISMNAKSIPHKLFTVNRWVTDEILYSAEDMIGLIDLFEIDIAKPSWPVNLWLGGMVQLFRPQIEQLLRDRDETYAQWQIANPDDAEMFENEDLEVTSTMDISVDDQVAGVIAELETRGETL